MTNTVRNKYKPRQNTPKSERLEQSQLWSANTDYIVSTMIQKGQHTNFATLERGLGHKLRGRKRHG